MIGNNVNHGADIKALLLWIRDAIRARLDGTSTIDQTRDEYRRILLEYARLEKKYISADAPGFIRGLLHEYNRTAGANLTAVFAIDDHGPLPLAFCGDRLLMKALPDLIAREYGRTSEETIARVSLAGREGRKLLLALKKISVSGHALVLASVGSSALRADDFQILSGVIESLYMKKTDSCSPVLLNYIHDISSAISRIVNAAPGARFLIDHFFLLSPYDAFAHLGMYAMIEFSDRVVDTLEKTYPPEANIFVHSVFKYLVLYDEKTEEGLDVKRNMIDFVFQGTRLPYKVLHREIDSPYALYLFLEEL
jgi:hypothetical protein